MSRSASFRQLIDEGVLEIGDGYRAKNVELGGNGPVFLRSAYLQDSGFVEHMPERFSTEDMSSFGGKVAQLGDVVITTKGNSTGRVGVIRAAQVGAVYSPHLSYWRSRDASVLDQGFLQVWSSSPEFRAQLAGRAYSTDMAPYLSLRDQMSLLISLPPIPDQRAIATTLGALDDKIELNRKMNETLEAMARALFRDWFVDFGPTRAKMEGHPAYLSEDLWSLFPDSVDEDGKPEGWGRFKLEQIADYHTKTLTPAKMANMEVEHFSLPAFDKGRIPAIDHGATIKSNKTLVPPQSVLLSKLNPEIPRVWTPEAPRALQQVSSTEFLAFTAKEGAGRSLLYCLFSDRTFRDMLEGMVTGTSKSHQRISPPSLLGQEVIAGTPTVFGAFEMLAELLLERVRANRAESRTLAQTRDLLLPRLMSGEVMVRAAETLG